MKATAFWLLRLLSCAIAYAVSRGHGRGWFRTSDLSRVKRWSPRHGWAPFRLPGCPRVGGDARGYRHQNDAGTRSVSRVKQTMRHYRATSETRGVIASAETYCVAMSSQNVELVRQDIAARSSRDWAVLAEIWHPDIELELVAESGTFRGLEE